MVGETNLWGWVCDWAEAGSEQGEEGVGKKVESKFQCINTSTHACTHTLKTNLVGVHAEENKG